MAVKTRTNRSDDARAMSGCRGSLFPLALAVAVMLVSLRSAASVVLPHDVVCPIGGAVFTTYSAMSGTQTGQYLDFKPWGRVIAPSPLPQCPDNGFVVYKERFSAAELARLQPYVLSDQYRALIKTETPYYLAAKLQEQASEDIRAIAGTLLRATWEAEDASRYARYAAAALNAYEQALRNYGPHNPERIQMELIAGELERRQGRFAEARRRLLALERRELGRLELPYSAILQQQLRLIDARDARPHFIDLR
jgi:hypothetical protein